MVLLSATDRVGAIELFVQHHASQLVRQGQRSQAPATFGAVQHGVRKPVRAADHERDVAAFHLPPTYELRELGRGPALTSLCQRDYPRILGDARLRHFQFLDFGVVPDPAQVVVTGRPERRALHAAAAQSDDAIAPPPPPPPPPPRPRPPPPPAAPPPRPAHRRGGHS